MLAPNPMPAVRCALETQRKFAAKIIRVAIEKPRRIALDAVGDAGKLRHELLRLGYKLLELVEAAPGEILHLRLILGDQRVELLGQTVEVVRGVAHRLE